MWYAYQVISIGNRLVVVPRVLCYNERRVSEVCIVVCSTIIVLLGECL